MVKARSVRRPWQVARMRSRARLTCMVAPDMGARRSSFLIGTGPVGNELFSRIISKPDTRVFASVTPGVTQESSGFESGAIGASGVVEES